MKPLDFRLLADENILPGVVQGLRERGKEVTTVHELGLAGHSDAAILAQAAELGRVVLTHDSDFGTLAIRSGAPHVGIIYLRPGHIEARFTLDILDMLNASATDVAAPFLLVAERRGESVRVRVRSVV